MPPTKWRPATEQLYRVVDAAFIVQTSTRLTPPSSGDSPQPKRPINAIIRHLGMRMPISSSTVSESTIMSSFAVVKPVYCHIFLLYRNNLAG